MGNSAMVCGRDGVVGGSVMVCGCTDIVGGLIMVRDRAGIAIRVGNLVCAAGADILDRFVDPGDLN